MLTFFTSGDRLGVTLGGSLPHLGGRVLGHRWIQITLFGSRSA